MAADVRRPLASSITPKCFPHTGSHRHPLRHICNTPGLAYASLVGSLDCAQGHVIECSNSLSHYKEKNSIQPIPCAAHFYFLKCSSAPRKELIPVRRARKCSIPFLDRLLKENEFGFFQPYRGDDMLCELNKAWCDLVKNKSMFFHILKHFFFCIKIY